MTTATHVEYRVIGPPGTGKTTWLSRQAHNATRAWCERYHVEPAACTGVLISSLTKAAAAELRKRGLELPDSQIGTLHSHAYRALGRPTLCHEGKPVKEWNEAQPLYRLSEGAAKDDGVGTGRTGGDRLLARYHEYRAKLRDRELWPSNLLAFAEAYESWKRVNHYLDFSDVIHEAWRTVETAPGNPEVIFVDEAQDHDRAELRLIRKWAEHCEKLVIVGDPDQNLYEWRGSEPEAFYEAEVPADRCRVLSQSYRVPRAVHAAAVRMIERCRDREAVSYEPKDEDGEVLMLGLPLIRTDCTTDVVRHAEKYLADGREVMFLATCDYMLRAICGELRERGIPFWNRYAPNRGQFNPLHPQKGVPATQRLLAFIRANGELHPRPRRWTFADFQLWTEVCYVDGLLKRGIGKWIEEQDPDAVMTSDDLRYVCASAAVVAELLDPRPATLLAHAKPDRVKSIQYAVHIFERSGIDGLIKSPQVTVGTIHSVKGGEADVVYLAPDMSPEAYEAFEGGKRDSTYRLMYVGMTRAKETLILCDPKTNMCVEW